MVKKNHTNLLSKIFTDNGTDISELLFTLFTQDGHTEDKKEIWRIWRDKFFSWDEVMNFFSDTLFKEDGSMTYMDVILKCEDYHNFYELAINLDLGNFDPTIYYIYWILTCDNQTNRKILEDAIEYDGDTILKLFPDIKEVLFTQKEEN